MRHASWLIVLALGCTGYSHPSVDEPEVEPDPIDEQTEDPDRWDEVTSEWTEPTEPAEDARALFEAGTQAFKNGDYATALENFEAAHALQPAGPLRFNMAVCLEKLGRTEEAAAQLDALADDATQPPTVREQAAKKRDALRGR